MSKSRGNIVRAETILDVLGADALRYFLLREIVFGQDGSFSFDALVQRYNSDLANGYGNLVSRTLTMIGKYFDGVVPEAAGVQADSITTRIPAAISAFGRHFDALDFSRGLESAWEIVAAVDGYLTASAPWKQPESISDEQQHALRATVLYTAAETIRIVTALIYPVLPEAAAKVWAQLGLGDIRQADLKDLKWGGLKPGTKLGELGPVFPRAEKDAVQRMKDIEETNPPPEPVATAAEPTEATAGHVPVKAPTAPQHHTSRLEAALDGFAVAMAESTSESAAMVAFENFVKDNVGGGSSTARASSPSPAAPAAASAAPSSGDKITIDDFAKIELRVAQIKVAERVPKADKLLRLEVDLGYEQRQILAGIAEAYTPESLVGRKVVIVANLAPRKLRGFESNGMIVAASLEGGQPVLAGFLEDVEIGARLK
jgi:methionyl-tRNA synthetase